MQKWPSSSFWPHSSDKVDDDEVEDNVREDEVGEGALGANSVELATVLRVHLRTS